MKTLSLTIICVLFLTSFNLGVNSKPFKRSFIEAQYLFLNEDYEAGLKTYDKLLEMNQFRIVAKNQPLSEFFALNELVFYLIKF